MPAYNSAEFIRPSIESVLSQTLKDFELIVVDDGSTDNTFEVAKSFADPRIKCLQKTNGGLPSARNFGLAHAAGEYIAYLDSDDRYLENHLLELSAFLDKNLDTGMVYSRGIMVDSSGKEQGEMGETFDKEKLEYSCYFIADMVMHRRKCLEKVGWWEEKEELRLCHEDWEFFLRFSDEYKIAYLDKKTVISIRSPEGQFFKSLKNRAYYTGMRYVVKKRLEKFLKEKRGEVVAPFDGYYFYLFQNSFNLTAYAEKMGILSASAMIDSFFIPFYLELSAIDSNNLEIWLLLILLYFMRGDSPKLIESAHKAGNLLDQRVDIKDREVEKLLISSLKAAAYELDQANEKKLAEGFTKKIKEFPAG